MWIMKTSEQASIGFNLCEDLLHKATRETSNKIEIYKNYATFLFAFKVLLSRYV